MTTATVYVAPNATKRMILADFRWSHRVKSRNIKNPREGLKLNGINDAMNEAGAKVVTISRGKRDESGRGCSDEEVLAANAK